MTNRSIAPLPFPVTNMTFRLRGHVWLLFMASHLLPPPATRDYQARPAKSIVRDCCHCCDSTSQHIVVEMILVAPKFRALRCNPRIFFVCRVNQADYHTPESNIKRCVTHLMRDLVWTVEETHRSSRSPPWHIHCHDQIMNRNHERWLV